MRIALAQFDAVVGDLEGNAAAIRSSAAEASDRGADLLVLPELCLLGYPPRDLLLREEVVPACERLVAELAGDLTIPTLIGTPRRIDVESRRLYNSMALCRGGRIEAWHDKMLLPTYDVFDEARWFQPGDRPLVFELEADGRTQRVGVLICEDLWRAEDVRHHRPYDLDPVKMLADAECDLIVSPSASPFVAGKSVRHRTILSDVARQCGSAVAMVNQFGANDDLIFDGGSSVISSTGRMVGGRDRFDPGVSTVDVDADSLRRDGPDDVDDLSPEAERFEAIRLAISGYCRRTGHQSVLLGLSGGIDSALVAALAVAALGPEAVLGVLLPSRYSSEGSRVDALELGERLGIRTEEIAIESMHATVSDLLDPVLRKDGVGLEGLADENVQARSRGLLLMAISNGRGHMLLSTSNKSELAVGYSTLYGDMCGGYAPIGDLYKTEAFELARWMNREHASIGFARPPIPVSSIEKPPSAELRPDQRDDDSLPPYETLDAYLRSRLDGLRSPAHIGSVLGLEPELVARIERLLAVSEFKRYQASIIPKLSPRTFGRGREMPVAARWNDGTGRQG
ncbi:MAG: NAD+ synthase [Phycisphaera sp. TMED9]|nr:MAG: NAD+ synthase [Phycisphaera sp. TMED9]